MNSDSIRHYTFGTAQGTRVTYAGTSSREARDRAAMYHQIERIHGYAERCHCESIPSAIRRGGALICNTCAGIIGA